MATNAVYFKEHQAIALNSSGHMSSVTSAPWWRSFGSQLGDRDSCNQRKSFSLELPNRGDQFTSTKPAGRGVEQGTDKGNTTNFTIFPGDAHKPNSIISLQSSVPDHCARFELGFGPSKVYGKYPHVDQYYGLFSAYGPQFSGRIMLPLNLTTDDGPIYVNAKQYHGIIRRRQCRAKAELENKVTKAHKPYMHESRHRHAMRRPRGSCGRFLKTKSLDSGKSTHEANEIGGLKITYLAGSHSSESQQSDGRTLNSSKDTSGSNSNISGSEVTSMYSRGELDCFQVSHLGLSIHSLANVMDNGHGIFMPSKWVAAVDNCCHLKV